MDKYGVVVDDEKIKTAGPKICPTCKKEMGRRTDTWDWQCSECGSTEHAEKRPPPQEK